jgi:tetratricopeptide (TPR) repeat protein
LILSKGRVTVRFVIDLDGQVSSVSDEGSTVPNRDFVQCVMQAFTGLRFPPPEGGIITVIYPLVFTDDPAKPPVEDTNERSYLDDIPKQYVPVKLQNPNYPLVPRDVGTEAYLGEYRAVMQALAERRTHDAEAAARSLRERQPNRVATYLAWGSVAKARGDLTEARRAFGSLIDRFDDSARLHRVAAAWLGHLGDPDSRALAGDALRSAIRLKDGRVETERQLAWLLAEAGDYESALQLITAAFLHQEYRQPTLLNQEIAILASALAAKHPDRYEAVVAQLRLSGTVLAATPKLIFAMQNESERGLALSIYTDPKSGVRFLGTSYSYSDRDHPSAYEVSKEQRNAPYTLRVVDRGWADSFRSQHTALGHVRILDFDGRGQLHVEVRPFVLQQDGAEVDLARYQ